MATDELTLVSGPQLAFPTNALRFDDAAKSPRLVPTSSRCTLPSFVTAVAVLGNADVAYSSASGVREVWAQSVPAKPQSQAQVGVEPARGQVSNFARKEKT